jgi:hypothetical protein
MAIFVGFVTIEIIESIVVKIIIESRQFVGLPQVYNIRLS